MKRQEQPFLELCLLLLIILNFNQMKNYAIIWFLIVSFLVSGCTDVIEIEVPQEPPRLVIEASIDWKKGTSGRFQTVNLSLSTPYFDTICMKG